MKPIEKKIKDAIEKNFSADFYEIINESHKHQGHAGDNGTGESHFHITIIDHAFNNKNQVTRQRMVYNALDDLMKDHIHALSLTTVTPDEYNTKE